MLPITGEMRKLITKDTDLDKVKAQAYKEGMKTLRINGAEKIAAGLTTFEEIIKVAPPGD
jgi:general secretion pathway protein E